jgi:hypothetical protein
MATGSSERSRWASDRHAGLASASLDELRAYHCRYAAFTHTQRGGALAAWTTVSVAVWLVAVPISSIPTPVPVSIPFAHQVGAPDKTRVLSRVPFPRAAAAPSYWGVWCLLPTSIRHGPTVPLPTPSPFLRCIGKALPRTVSTHLGWRLATRDSRHYT